MARKQSFCCSFACVSALVGVALTAVGCGSSPQRDPPIEAIQKAIAKLVFAQNGSLRLSPSLLESLEGKCTNSQDYNQARMKRREDQCASQFNEERSYRPEAHVKNFVSRFVDGMLGSQEGFTASDVDNLEVIAGKKGAWCGMPLPEAQGQPTDWGWQEYWKEHVMKNAGYFNVLKCDVPHKGERVTTVLGLAALNRDVCYPAHTHNSEEAYWQVGGFGMWKLWSNTHYRELRHDKPQTEKSDFTPGVPCDDDDDDRQVCLHEHKAGSPHEMDTTGRFGDEPMLMVYFWGMNYAQTKSNNYTAAGFEQFQLMSPVKESCGYRILNGNDEVVFGTIGYIVNILSIMASLIAAWIEEAEWPTHTWTRQDADSVPKTALHVAGKFRSFLSLAVNAASTYICVRFSLVRPWISAWALRWLCLTLLLNFYFLVLVRAPKQANPRDPQTRKHNPSLLSAGTVRVASLRFACVVLQGIVVCLFVLLQLTVYCWDLSWEEIWTGWFSFIACAMTHVFFSAQFLVPMGVKSPKLRPINMSLELLFLPFALAWGCRAHSLSICDASDSLVSSGSGGGRPARKELQSAFLKRLFGVDGYQFRVPQCFDLPLALMRALLRWMYDEIVKLYPVDLFNAVEQQDEQQHYHPPAQTA